LWRGSSCRSCRCICNRTWKIEWQQLNNFNSKGEGDELFKSKACF
jgi:hypothetical protein